MSYIKKKVYNFKIIYDLSSLKQKQLTLAHKYHHLYIHFKKFLKMGVYCEYPADGTIVIEVFIYRCKNTP